MDIKKKKNFENELIKVIKEHKIAFFSHCFAFTSFSSATAYNYELEKLESIKEEINKNRVLAKDYMLQKWITGKNPTLQLCAYRLLSSSEEHKKLNQSYVESNTNQEGPNKIEVEIVEGKYKKDEGI